MNLNSTKVIFSVFGDDPLHQKYIHDHQYIMDNLMTDKLNPVQLFGELNRKSVRFIMLESWNADSFEANLTIAKRIADRCGQDKFFVVYPDNAVVEYNLFARKMSPRVGTLNVVGSINDAVGTFFYEPTTKRYFSFEDYK